MDLLRVMGNKLKYVLFHQWHCFSFVFSKCVGIKKKLIAASKRFKDSDIILVWVKSIVSHLYYCACTSNGDGQLIVAKWLSILNHISNVHSGHSPIFPTCEHGPLERRRWIKQGVFGRDCVMTCEESTVLFLRCTLHLLLTPFLICLPRHTGTRPSGCNCSC